VDTVAGLATERRRRGDTAAIHANSVACQVISDSNAVAYADGHADPDSQRNGYRNPAAAHTHAYEYAYVGRDADTYAHAIGNADINAHSGLR
jgi:hypothetical protein